MDEYFTKEGPWQDGQIALRRIFLDLGTTEHRKWNQPVYMHAGRNIAIMGGFKNDFRLTFMNGELLTDTQGILRPAGPNAQVSNVLFMTSNDDPTRLEPTIRAYALDLMRHAETGTKPEKSAPEFTLPDELTAALDADPALAEAFHALTPGRQRSYVIALSSAKKPETRVARVEKLRPMILAGKGAQGR